MPLAAPDGAHGNGRAQGTGCRNRGRCSRCVCARGRNRGAGGPWPKASHDIEVMFEERLRIGLALMSDAGFDPWQAPETLAPHRAGQDFRNSKLAAIHILLLLSARDS